MFGIIKGCGCGLSRREKREWVSHVCGLCLTLRDNYGQLSRFATNYDAALLSVLYEAQSPQPVERLSHTCAIRGRGFQRAEVVASNNAGAQYAASLAVLMATTKLEDHLVDGDTWLGYLPGFITRWPQQWLKAARRQAKAVGFRIEAIETQTVRQLGLEQQTQPDFLFYSQPTELAVGAAFRHTAVLTGCPQNSDPLYHLGRMFGRIMYLLDSYRDYAGDLAQNKFNALAVCYKQEEIQSLAQCFFEQAYAELRRHFNRLTLVKPQLAHKLLIHQLGQIGRRMFAEPSPVSNACPLSPSLFSEEKAPASKNKSKRRRQTNADHRDSWFCFDCCYCCEGCGRATDSDGSCCGCCGDSSHDGCDCCCVGDGHCGGNCDCGDCCSSCDCCSSG